MSTEQLPKFCTIHKAGAVDAKIAKERTESYADSAPKWTWQPHAQLSFPASLSPVPSRISALLN